MSHLCFIDFNDTLFPSSLFLPCFRKDRFVAFPEEAKESLKQLDIALEAFFKQYITDIRFVIFTRSNQPWIAACLRYIPRTAKLIRWYIPIILVTSPYSLTDHVGAWINQHTLPKEFTRISCISKSDAAYAFEKEWWHKIFIKHFFCLKTFSQPSTETLIDTWVYYTSEKDWIQTNRRSVHRHCVIE